MLLQFKPIFVLTLIICSWLACSQAQATKSQNLDMGQLLAGGSREPIWKLMDRNLPKVQQMIDSTKQRCLKKLQMPLVQRSLISERNPTAQEKCLVECILKGIKIMDKTTNRLNVRQVENLTSMVSEKNKMLMALTSSMAHSCNSGVRATDPCEVAHQLNQCIGTQIKRCKINLNW